VKKIDNKNQNDMYRYYAEPRLMPEFELEGPTDSGTIAPPTGGGRTAGGGTTGGGAPGGGTSGGSGSPAPTAPGNTPPGKYETLWKHDTDLDAPYFGGNFDFLYNGGANEAVVTLNTYINWRKRFSPADQNAFIARMKSAVSIWDNAAQIQIRDSSGNYSKQINLRFALNVVTDRHHSNKVSDVHESNTRAAWFMQKNRENVMREINVFIGSTRNTLVHELGHVWGLLDEYDAGWLENHFSVGHVSTDSEAVKDKLSIMNIGYDDEVNNTGEFRTRFFIHFGRAIAGAFWGVPEYVKKYMYQGKQVSHAVLGRVALVKKNIAGASPYTSDTQFNPQFSTFQITKRN
jgi:hypothetical protein